MPASTCLIGGCGSFCLFRTDSCICPLRLCVPTNVAAQPLLFALPGAPLLLGLVRVDVWSLSKHNALIRKTFGFVGAELLSGFAPVFYQGIPAVSNSLTPRTPQFPGSGGRDLRGEKP